MGDGGSNSNWGNTNTNNGNNANSTNDDSNTNTAAVQWFAEVWNQANPGDSVRQNNQSQPMNLSNVCATQQSQGKNQQKGYWPGYGNTGKSSLNTMNPNVLNQNHNQNQMNQNQYGQQFLNVQNGPGQQGNQQDLAQRLDALMLEFDAAQPNVNTENFNVNPVQVDNTGGSQLNGLDWESLLGIKP